MRKELDPKVVVLSLVGLVVVAGAFLYFKAMGPGASVPESENVQAMSEQYQNDLNSRGGGGSSEAELRQQNPGGESGQ